MCIFCGVFASACFAGLAEDPETIDGLLITGEYVSSVWGENNEELIVMGGGAFSIEMWNYSYIEVQYTSTPLSYSTGIYDIFLYDTAELLYLDGITEEITLKKNATATLKGGRIDGITSYQTVGWWNGEPVGQHIEMVVKTYSYNEATHTLTGTWANNSAYEILLLNQSGYADVIDNIKFTIVPEPATLALLGLGGLLIRCKKR